MCGEVSVSNITSRARRRSVLSAYRNPVVERGYSWLMTPVPRRQPFLQRMQNRILKKSKARSGPDPNNERETDEGDASQFPSIFNRAPKDLFHTGRSQFSNPLLSDCASTVSGFVQI